MGKVFDGYFDIHLYGTTKILSLMVHFVGLIAHRPIEYLEPLQSGHWTNRKFKKRGERFGIAAAFRTTRRNVQEFPSALCDVRH